MKWYFTFLKTPILEPHYQIQFSVRPRTLVGWWALSLCKSPVVIFYSLACHVGGPGLILSWCNALFKPGYWHNGLGDWGSIPGGVIPKTKQMVLSAALLSTQHYKMRIKGKVEQSRERSCALLYTSVWELLKGEPLGHPRLRSPTLLFTICKSIRLKVNVISCQDFELTYFEVTVQYVSHFATGTHSKVIQIEKKSPKGVDFKKALYFPSRIDKKKNLSWENVFICICIEQS